MPRYLDPDYYIFWHTLVDDHHQVDYRMRQQLGALEDLVRVKWRGSSEETIWDWLLRAQEDGLISPAERDDLFAKIGKCGFRSTSGMD